MAIDSTTPTHRPWDPGPPPPPTSRSESKPYFVPQAIPGNADASKAAPYPPGPHPTVEPPLTPGA